MTGLPVIDVSGLRASDPAARAAVAAQLGAACRGVGFFYITGHGIADALLDSVFAAAHQFFALPEQVKLRQSIKLSPHNRGYVALGAERLDETAPPDHKEAFNIGLDLAAEDPDVVAGKPFRGVNLWPSLPGWRDTVLAYFDACWALGRTIHRGFARDLGVAEDFFDDKLDAPLATLRLLHYPAPADVTEVPSLGVPGLGVPSLGAPSAGAPGAGAHTDYGNLTILAVGGVAGLQVRRRDGVWLDAPQVPGALVCNIGDCLMRWTNDVYVSTPHRVIRPAAERFSVAFFLDPNPDACVAVLPAVLQAGATAKYPPITGAAYLQSRLAATYDHLRDAPG